MNFVYTADTLQGEGTYTGVAVDIVRVVGCNVGCKFCDEPAGESVEYVAGMLAQLRGGSQRPILLTGGEPLQQISPGLMFDIAHESKSGRLPILLVETSGVGDWNIMDSLLRITSKRSRNVVTISPKHALMAAIRAATLNVIDELVIKYLWSAKKNCFVGGAGNSEMLAGCLTSFAGRGALVVQPVDGGQIYEERDGLAEWYYENYRNIERALQDDPVCCIIKDKWREVPRILPQLHKILNMP